ncbi:hypothetical protein PanWU01x14_052320 [Parasponia andersonii]|uniref:Uncharacterized protein n=1 Tax=Parasponia andersonii TaxID=3476 RepID=A0A2P5DM78_PARAD|nr:hypothetical protein PanWU01x14_052320 [Parasponia andersonii]
MATIGAHNSVVKEPKDPNNPASSLCAAVGYVMPALMSVL